MRNLWYKLCKFDDEHSVKLNALIMVIATIDLAMGNYIWAVAMYGVALLCLVGDRKVGKTW